MKYLDKDYFKALELINSEVDDEELKEKLLAIYIKDIRKREHEYFRHDKRNVYYDQIDSVYFKKIEGILSASVEDSHTIAMQKIENEELYEAINQLTKTEKLIIQLFFFRKLNTVQIANILGIAQQNVSKTKNRALKKLKNSKNIKKFQN